MSFRNVRMHAIAPCLLAIIVDAMGFGLVYPLMTAMFTSLSSPVLPGDASLHLRHFYLGLGFMLYPLCMFFGASFMGDLSDSIGRKNVLLLCMSGIALSFFAMGLGAVYGSLWLLFIGRGLSGLMAGSQPIAQAAVSDLSTPETKALNMSIMTLALSAGIVVGPLIGGICSDSQLASFFTFSTPFFIAAVLAVISVLWILISFQETFVNRQSANLSFLRPITIIIEAFKHPSVRILALVFLLMQVGFSLYFQFILVHLKLLFNYSNWQLGVFNGFIGFSFALALLVVIRTFLKYWQIGTIAVVSLFLVGAGEILTVLTHSQIIIWVLGLIVGIFDMVAYTAMLTSFSNAASADKQGWAMGISGAVMAMSWALTGLFANLIPELGTQGLILLGGVCLLISSAIMGKFAIQQKRIAS